MKKLKNIVFIFIILLFSGFLLRGKISGIPFDSQKWKTMDNTEEQWSLRWDMMNSLRNNHELKGLNEEEIIHLLGEPTYIERDEWNYYLGYSKHGINTGSLKIKFGFDKKVVSYYVWQG